MKKRSVVVTCVVALVCLGAAVTGVSAQQDKGKSAPPSVAGKWTMSVQTDQGEITAGLVLNVDGRKVTGSFTSDHTGEAQLEGKLEDGALTFSIALHGDQTMEVSFTGKLKDDGTLAGRASGPMGDFTWTAARPK